MASESPRQSSPPRRSSRHGDEPQDPRLRRVREASRFSRKRAALIFGGIVVLIIAGVTVGLWYTQFYAPPRVKAAMVNDTRFNQGDLVKRVRMLQAAQGYTAAYLDLTQVLRVLYNPDLDVASGPFTFGMVQMELLIQGAPEFGVEVSENQVESYVRAIFEPSVQPGEILSPDQLEQEFRERYESYLNLNRISDSDFRRLMEEQAYFFGMREAIGEDVPEVEEHVEVYWLRTPIRPDPALGDPAKYQDLTLIHERLQEEAFEDVAVDYSNVFQYADSSGYVGWVPKGAFPKLDVYLFADPEIGAISEPVESGGYLHYMKVVGGPEELEVTPDWAERLKDMALQLWMDERFAQGTSEGWVEVKFDSHIYAWAAEQLRQTAEQKRGDTPPGS